MSEPVYRRCCGMDVHKNTVVVCVLPPDRQSGKPLRKVYGTFRNELTRLRGWLKQLHVTDRRLLASGVERVGRARIPGFSASS
jgi:transposase